MELFSKRNKGNSLRGMPPFRFRHGREEDEGIKLIGDNTRIRLNQQIKYFSSTDKFLERYMMVHDENKNVFYLYEKMLVDFTTREAGYDISDVVRIDSLEFKSEKPNDSIFFDFIEILLIFSLEGSREELVKRFNKIFKEEKESYIIHGFMIVDTEHSGLRSALHLIKDSLLQKKLKEYYKNALSDGQYDSMARISAEILQRITTSPVSKSMTKDYAEELCEAVAIKWTNEVNTLSLKNLLNETIKNSKDLSNQVSNIRHLDQTTIPVDSPKMFKLIASKNINIIELIILTLPERFISEQSPDELKAAYIKDYNIDTTAKGRIQKKKVVESFLDDINPEDIPF